MSAPTRLRFVATRYPHWGKHAGIGQFVRHLDASRYRAEVRLCADDDSQFPLPVAAWRTRLRDHVQRSGMAWYKLSDLAEEMRAWAACAQRRAGLVHFLDGEHGVQFLPRWLDRLPGRRPVIVANYHQPPELLPELVDPQVIARLDMVVLVSPTQRPFFEQFLPQDRIVTILHGVDTDFFRPGKRADDPIFRCVTAGHWLRDWEAMQAAAQALVADPNIEFHVVTGGVTGLEHLPNVHIHKGLSDDRLVALYQSCDVGLLPLHQSTANNSLLEFLACGLPLISTDLAAVRAYAGDNEAVLLPPGSRSGFADTIGALKADPDRRSAMSRAARARAAQLSWPIIARQYAELYARLLKKGQTGVTQTSGSIDRPYGDPVMTVSVIIPARNAGATLGATLDSLLNQSWQDWRAIVIDDGSTDDTRAIAEDYARRDPRLRVIEGPGLGAGAARNAGLAVVQAPWVLFLDSDDMLDPSMIGRMMDSLAAHPWADAVHCGWTYTDWNGKPIGQARCLDDRADLFPKFVRYCAFVIHSCIVRRALVDAAGGFDRQLVTCEDFDLWQRIARLGADFVALDDHLVTYRLREKLSWFNASRFLSDALVVVERGHACDPRLPAQIVPRANLSGAPRDGLEPARLEIMVYAAGLAIAHGGDTRPLLERIERPRSPGVDLDDMVGSLVNAIPLALCRPATDWPEIWPDISDNLARFADALADHVGAPDLSKRLMTLLATRVAQQVGHDGPHASGTGGMICIGSTAVVHIEMACGIADVETDATAERLLCVVYNHGHFFGTLILPVFAGHVPSVVLADALAARFAWPLLNSLFSVQVYPTLGVHHSETGWTVERDGVSLASGLSDDPRADGRLHDMLGWLIFAQELIGLPEWTLDQLYDEAVPHPESHSHTMAVISSPVRVELSQPLPTLVDVDETAMIEVTLGGATVFQTILTAENGAVPAGRLRAAILDRGKMELARIAVREAIVGYEGALETSLRTRLAAAAERRAPVPPVECVAGVIAMDRIGAWVSSLMASPTVPDGSRLGIIGSVRHDIHAANLRRAALPTKLFASLPNGLEPHQPALAINSPPVELCLYLPDLIETAARRTQSRRELSPQSPTQGSAYGRHHFEALFAKGADPWSYTSPYEQAKYEQTLGLLPPGRIGKVLEIGCAEGHFTCQIAPLVKSLVATDISELALERTGERCSEFDHVQYRQLDLVADDLPGKFDLIICSELLYYMGDASGLAGIGAKLARGLSAGGYLLTAHANLVVDDPGSTGFDWGMPYGAKKIGETFASVPDLIFEKELQTPLYRIQLFRKRRLRPLFGAGREAGKPRAVIAATHSMPEPEVARHILWDGGSVAVDNIKTTTSRLPILMYHAVSDAGPAPLARWRVTPDMFEAQIRYLQRAGFQPASLDEWRVARETFTPLDGRRVLITFDDGYADFERNVLPVLQRYGFPAMLFVPTDKVGHCADWDSWSGQASPLADWDCLRRLRDAGIGIGSHSASHRHLAGLSPTEVADELWLSRARIERELQVEVDMIAYPFGAHDEVVEHLAAACGYRHGLTTRHGMSELADRDFALARVEIFGGETLESFIRLISE